MSIGRISQIQQETRMKMMYHLLSNEKKDEIQKQNQQTRRWFQTVKPPDLSGMYTKRKPEMSEEAYIKAIETQAREDAKNDAFQSSDEFKKIRKSYVSVVSPDRAGLINSYLQQARQGPNAMGGTKYSYIVSTMGGEDVAHLAEEGWRFVLTRSEGERSAKFFDIYNTAFKAAQKELRK